MDSHLFTHNFFVFYYVHYTLSNGDEKTLLENRYDVQNHVSSTYMKGAFHHTDSRYLVINEKWFLLHSVL